MKLEEHPTSSLEIVEQPPLPQEFSHKLAEAISRYCNSAVKIKLKKKYRPTAKIVMILKFEQCNFTIEKCIQKDADGMANMPPHDKTNKMACAPSEDSN